MTRTTARGLLGALALSLQFAFVWLYLTHERNFVFWDYAMYADMALGLWTQPSWAAFWSGFTQSFAHNYNLLFALPHGLSFALFGASRDIFILTNTLLYLGAYQAAAALILARLFKLTFAQAFVWAAGFMCLIPFGWYPLLQGYPDHGAAALLLAGLGLALRPSNNLKQAALIGAFWGLAIVFRRPYAYAVLALFLSLGLWEMGSLLSAWKDDFFASLKKRLPYTLLMGLTTVGVIAAMEPAYMKEMITTNYLALYRSYERPPSYFALFALSRIGLSLALLSLIGFVLAYKNQHGKTNGVGFVALATFVWLLLWGFGPSQAGEHYLIGLLPLALIVGLAGFFVGLKKHRFRTPLRAALIIFLAAGSAHALWFAPRITLPSDTPSLGFFSSPRPPWVRQDFDELLALGRHLEQTTTDQDRIVIVGSSFNLNQDMMGAVFTDGLHNPRLASRLLFAPESDGQQGPPLTPYTLGTVFVVGSPTQYHLDPAGQKVVTALASRFPPSELAAPFFKKDERTFQIDNNVSVTIWRKTTLPPAALHEGLQAIRAFKNHPQQWVLASTQAQAGIMGAEPNETLLAAHPRGALLSTFFLDQELNTLPQRIMGSLSFKGRCDNVNVTARLTSPEGKTLEESSARSFSNEQLLVLPFSSAKTTASSFLTLEVRTSSVDFCTVALGQLRLEQWGQ